MIFPFSYFIMMVDKWVRQVLHSIRNKLNIVALPSVLELTYNKDNNTILLPVNYNINDLISIVSNYSFPNLRILSTSLITKEVIEAIKNNTHISSITLGVVFLFLLGVVSKFSSLAIL